MTDNSTLASVSEDQPPRPDSPAKQPGRAWSLAGVLWWVAFVVLGVAWFFGFRDHLEPVPSHGFMLYHEKKLAVNLPGNAQFNSPEEWHAYWENDWNGMRFWQRRFWTQGAVRELWPGGQWWREKIWLDGWYGWDFKGIIYAACVLHQSQGKHPIYPEATPEDLSGWGTWIDELAKEFRLDFLGSGTYIYPPLTAVLFSRIAEEGPWRLFARWVRMSRLLMAGLILACGLLARRCYGRWAARDWLICAAMAILNYPIMWGLIETANVTILLAVLTTASALLLLGAWRGALWTSAALLAAGGLWGAAVAVAAGTIGLVAIGWKFEAGKQLDGWVAPVLFGACLALAIHIKISPIILLPWLVLRRQWKPLVAVTVFGLAWLAVSVAGAGWEEHVRFLRVVGPWLERGTPFAPNQSLHAVIRRAFEPAEAWQFSGRPAPAEALFWCRLVGWGVLGATYALLFALSRRRASGLRLALEFGLLMMAGLAVSPFGWEVHYTHILFVWVLLYGAMAWLLAGWRRWAALALFFPGWYLNTVFVEAWRIRDAVHEWIYGHGLGGMAPGWQSLIESAAISYQLWTMIPALVILLMAHKAAAPPASLGQTTDEQDEADFDDWDDLSLEARERMAEAAV